MLRRDARSTGLYASTHVVTHLGSLGPVGATAHLLRRRRRRMAARRAGRRKARTNETPLGPSDGRGRPDDTHPKYFGPRIPTCE